MNTTDGPGWRCDIDATGDQQTLRLAGELDMSAASALHELLHDATTRFVTVHADLAAVRFIDSTAITTLVDAHNNAVKLGHQFTVTNARGHVRRVLGMTGILRTLT